MFATVYIWVNLNVTVQPQKNNTFGDRWVEKITEIDKIQNIAQYWRLKVHIIVDDPDAFALNGK